MTQARPGNGVAALRTVLFDLDGTLADTAPDLAAALNHVLEAEGRTALPYEHIRPVVSHGARALVQLGFSLGDDHPEFSRLRQRLTDRYREHIAVGTRLFPGMDELLERLEDRGLAWGVVTNKPAWLTNPLMDALGLTQRAACIVSGDTTPHRKPHPQPMLHACELAGSLPEECIYVGDAERDVEAGRSAGMRTVVALFGYLGESDRPQAWGADGLIEHPLDLLDWVGGHG